MQSKLNEILELCIEKSGKYKGVFYSFKYDTIHSVLIIERRDGTNKSFDLAFGLNDRGMNQALEYMQN